MHSAKTLGSFVEMKELCSTFAILLSGDDWYCDTHPSLIFALWMGEHKKSKKARQNKINFDKLQEGVLASLKHFFLK